jgi:hypothetical protein
MTVNASTSCLQETTSASPPSSKAERNRCKKESAKKRKAEESQKKSEEADLLSEMSTMSFNKRGVDHNVKGNSSSPFTCSSTSSLFAPSPTEEKPVNKVASVHTISPSSI